MAFVHLDLDGARKDYQIIEKISAIEVQTQNQYPNLDGIQSRIRNLQPYENLPREDKAERNKSVIKQQ